MTIALAPDITAEDLLWEWCRFGWDYRRLGERPQAEQEWYVDRIKYEMGMILSKDLADFFLFTSDVLRWAKDNGIPIGPGRGSTAASVVAWLLRITEVDPHKYPGMIFERFLDVTRHDPPDIDVDCSDDRRWEVYDYVAGKYGPECVGHIANFVRYKAKNALQDVAKVYRIPIWEREKVANVAIGRSGGDSRSDATLEDTFDMFPAAQEVAESYPDILQACRLEGDYRQMSVHACGLVVANSPLTDICAVYERKGERVLSIDKIDVEYIDGLKLDFLGLTSMGMIARCLDMAGLTLDDLYAIPDDDMEVIDMFRRGDLIGVFQFEGRATRIVCRNVMPDDFRHLTHINALSRPGPLFSNQTTDYVEVRHGRAKPYRMHPIIDEITKDTYGQFVFQEQILMTLKDVGALEWTNVHHIRRIIAKKAGQAAFQQSFGAFAEGAARLHGIDEEKADEIWKRLVTSGTYAFNIAHAVSYTKLAFWTAWLKKHYPLEFYAASLQKAAGDKEKSFRLMRDALAHSIDIKPPHLGSGANWAPHDGALHAGWNQVPGIGAQTAPRIVAEAPYASWTELQRVHGIGPKTVDKLEAFSTARDPFGLYRTEERLAKVKRWIKSQKDVPLPTHDGDQVAAIFVERPKFEKGKKPVWVKGPTVIYMGVVRAVEYKDIVEDMRTMTGKEYEEIIAELAKGEHGGHPDLIKRATLHCYDAGDELIYLRINRFRFQKFVRILEGIRPNHDVIVCVGERIGGFGTPVRVEKLYVLDPE